MALRQTATSLARTPRVSDNVVLVNILSSEGTRHQTGALIGSTIADAVASCPATASAAKRVSVVEVRPLALSRSCCVLALKSESSFEGSSLSCVDDKEELAFFICHLALLRLNATQGPEAHVVPAIEWRNKLPQISQQVRSASLPSSSNISFSRCAAARLAPSCAPKTRKFAPEKYLALELDHRNLRGLKS